METVQTEGNRQIKRNIRKGYNLDAVVAKNVTTATDGKTYLVEYYNLE